MTVMATLSAICAAIQAVVGELDGIRVAPDAPTEMSNIQDTTAFCYPHVGSIIEVTGGQLEADHTITMSIITPRRNMRTDWARIVGFGETVPRALLLDQTLGGVVMAISQIRYTFGEVQWAGQQELGWQFEIDVMAQGTTS